MDRLLNNIGLGLIALIAVPLFLVVLLLFLPMILALTSINAFRKKRRIHKWIAQNDYSYFLIHTTGRWKRQFFEEKVIPNLSPGIEIGTFDGVNFKGFMTSEIARYLKLNDQGGFPIVGKIENGILSSRSMKAKFLHYIQNENNTARFMEVLQETIDDL